MQQTITKTGLGLAAGVLLAACSSTPQTATMANGSMATRIDCDGTTDGMNYCFERAGKMCGAAGYTLVDSNGVPISGKQGVNPGMETVVKAYEMDKNTIYVICGS